MRISNCFRKMISFAFVLAIALSFSNTDFLYALTRGDDCRSNEGQSIFAPGYINAAKQQAEATMSEDDVSRRGMWENLVSYMQARFANKASGGLRDDVRPDLQRKSSSQGQGAVAAEQSEELVSEAALAFNPIDPMAAQQVLSEAIENGMSVTTLSNGSMISLWREGSDTYFSIRDAQGAVLANKKKFAVAGWNNVYTYNITDLGEGQFATIVYGYSYEYKSNLYSRSDNVYSLQIYSAAGANAGNILTQRNYYSHYYYDYKTRYYSGDSTYVSNLTSLGGGQYALSVNKYSYKYNASGYANNSETYVSVTNRNLNINTGKRYNLKNYSSGSWAQGNYSYVGQYVNSITSLGNGTFAFALSEYYYDQKTGRSGDGTYIKIMDGALKTKNEQYFEGSHYEQGNGYYKYEGKYLSKVTSLGGGKFATAWTIYSGYTTYNNNSYISSYNSSISVEKFDSRMKKYESYDVGRFSSSYSPTYYSYSSGYLTDMKALDDGSLILAINESSGNYNYKTRKYSYSNDASLKMITSEGQKVDIGLKGSMGGDSNKYVSQLTVLGGGKFAIVLEERSSTGTAKTKKSIEQFSVTAQPQGGKEIIASCNTAPAQASATGSLAELSDSSKSTSSSKSVKNQATNKKSTAASSNKTSLLQNNKTVIAESGTKVTTSTAAKVTKSESAAACDALLNAAGDKAEHAAILKNVLANPTDEQKKIIDTVSRLLSDTEGLKMDSMDPGAIGNAVDEFVKAAVTALLAQAMPDLFKDADASSIKSVFSELESAKGKVVGSYLEAVKPYYENVKKDIARNIDALQMDGAVDKKITREDLDRLPRSELDKMLEKIKRKTSRTSEEEYVLQQESKYRKTYLDPNKKKLEDDMKDVLEEFTQKLNGSLEAPPK